MRSLSLLLISVLSLLFSSAQAEIDVEEAKSLLKITTPPQGFPLEGAEQIAAQVWTEAGELPQLKIKLGGKEYPLPLQETLVHVEISGLIAQVELIQRYHNPLPEPLEALYLFPLPESSAVNEMHIRIEDRIIRAQIKDRQAAREAFKKARETGKAAALLEQQRPNIFSQHITNIPPDEEIEIQISYLQRLSYGGGEYEFVFPMVVGPRFLPQGSGWSLKADQERVTPAILGAGMRTGHDIQVEVQINTALPIQNLRVPTHAVECEEEEGQTRVQLSDEESIPNRDFILRYRLDTEEIQASLLTHKQGEMGYFSLLLQPPKLDIKARVGQRELIFVVDVSGSMKGRPLALCKESIRLALSQIQPHDTFNIYTFAGTQARAFEAPEPANDAQIKRALSFIDAAQAGGGTLMAGAVKAALTPKADSKRHRYVFFLTDGYVGNEAEIFRETGRLIRSLKAQGRRARVFAFGAGSSVNRHLTEGIAQAGFGLAVYASEREDPSHALKRFFRAIDHPVLRDLRLHWEDLEVQDLQPAPLPDLFASRPLLISGRYQKPGEGRLIIEGNTGAKPYRLALELELPEEEEQHRALSSLWARERIAALQAILWEGHDQGAVDEIRELGLRHRLVTAYTSFIAVDKEGCALEAPARELIQPVEAPRAVELADQLPAEALRAHAIPKRRPSERAAGISLRAKRRRPSRTLSFPRVDGSMNSQAVQRVIRRQRREIQRLYERALKKDSQFRGRVMLYLIIDSKGSVKSAKISESSLNHKSFEEALCRLALKWKFPALEGEKETTLSFPFIFSSGAD